MLNNTVSAPDHGEATVEYPDLLFGVGCATSPGPTLPGGSIHPSPETLKKDCGGYSEGQPIVGFGQAYTSGAGGKKCYGNFLLAPFIGNDIILDRKERASFAIPGSETAKCYRYSVTLENGISISASPSHHSAIYTLDFPADTAGGFIIDAAHKLDIDAAMRSGSLTVDPGSKRIFGGGRYFGNWSGIDWDMYFSLQFDADFSEIGIFNGDKLFPISGITREEAEEEKRLGAYVKFSPDGKRTVKVKIAISFVSPEKAGEFLTDEIPDFDADTVEAEAKEKWQRIFDAIEIKTDDTALLRRFYTAMYHMHVQPRDRTKDHGTWDDFHTVWDSWKTNFPLYSLLYPEKLSSIIDSFVDRAERNEKEGNGIVLAECYDSGKEFLAGQGGNDTDNVIADAIVKGLSSKKYSREKWYGILLRSAETMRSPEYREKGFALSGAGEATTVSGASYSKRFKAGSATLGFAFNDRAVANAAAVMGDEENRLKYLESSENWHNAWNSDAESEGFYGFPQNPREDGSFEEGFDPHSGYNTDFYEASSWDAAYTNFNDTEGLITAMGGKETFIRRLWHACESTMDLSTGERISKKYLNFTNEPSFQIPWLFCARGIDRPDLAARVVNGVIAAFSLDDGYPGDEDNGAMSSYYVFMMCGLYPLATTDTYFLHGTRLEQIRLRMGNGKELLITGENAGGDNIYVQSATLNGLPYRSCRISHSQLLCGGELRFVMGSSPSDWGKGE